MLLIIPVTRIPLPHFCTIDRRLAPTSPPSSSPPSPSDSCSDPGAQLAAACYAVGAATCFGLTSGTVRAVWLGHATSPTAVVGLTAAVVGIALAQHAYRDGGLGAPLATLTLVDPLSAGALGVLLLGETLNLTPTHLTAVAGATGLGVVLLSQPRPPPDDPAVPMFSDAVAEDVEPGWRHCG